MDNLGSFNRQPGNNRDQEKTQRLKAMQEINTKLAGLRAEFGKLKAEQGDMTHLNPKYWIVIGKINGVGGEIATLENKLDQKKDEERFENESEPNRKKKIGQIIELKKDIRSISYAGERLNATQVKNIDDWKRQIVKFEAELVDDNDTEEDTKSPEEIRDAKFAELYNEIRGMKEITNSSGRVYTPVEIIGLIERVRSGKSKIEFITNNGGLRGKVANLLTKG